ncbi:YlbF family regulator [Secundilactobacillus silagei]|uniref:UPF0342 protein IWT126_01275 n=1 Tax=Secundilactobacillus silagei JCM 19001 TaxID=1302250 RepID=A0A1Z5IHS9_9LACO|nr:YlbF family regulator [Secundilactobacillus silagei]TDG72458.1 hypothetical protein C5L25_001834 [Secundilactobacillus silagei JCM 19001]GAX01249.1 hypothetical protein IWT126_01275 [Secundilactobacillus silagei JCM 19001]
MADIEKTAGELREELASSDEFTALQSAYNTMKADSEAYDLFKKFQELQLKLQQKQMQGQQPDQDEMKQAQDMATKVGAKDVIKDLMEKEKDVNQLLARLNNDITKPIQDLYQS